MTKQGTMTRKEDVMTSEFSGQEVLESTPSTKEVTLTLELPNQEEQGTTATPTYSSMDQYKIATTPRKEKKPEEVVATSECSGRTELASTSILTLEEGIPIIKEESMLNPKFSSQAELGSASTLMTKERTATRKEEDVMTSEFSGQEVLGSTPSTGKVTVTLELSIQEEQGTTATPTYSSRDEHKIVITPNKERNP